MHGRFADILDRIRSALGEPYLSILESRRFLFAVRVSELKRSAPQGAYHAERPLDAWSLITGLENHLVHPDLFIFRHLLTRDCTGRLLRLRFRLLLRQRGILDGP